MLLKKLTIFVIILLLISGGLHAQIVFPPPSPCSLLGQNPQTAFPVCGTAIFHQDTVPLCGGRKIVTPCNDDTLYSDLHPFWYKFTCFQSGKLSFLITPDTIIEDYDWQMFDITGKNPQDVYTDLSMFVACSWSGIPGVTGASEDSGGVNLIECESLTNRFTKMPDLIAGHDYLLMISHYENTQYGYNLTFGGTANTVSITDTLSPHMFTASRATCDGSKILVKLNKRMRCSSLAADGTDFMISPAAATITSAVGFGCSTGFDMDSVLLTFNAPLPVGNYNLIAKKGSDTTTINDLCYNAIPVGEKIPFTVLSPVPVPFDSLTNNKCSSDSLTVMLPDLIQCGSVAANGSDFFVTGTYPVNITNATPKNCINGLSRQIVVHFTSTLFQPGNFQLMLKKGDDGNTLLSECDTPSIAGSIIPFKILPKPVAYFNFTDTVCLPEGKVFFANNSTIADGSENSFRYSWNFGDTLSSSNTSAQKAPTHIYNNTGPFMVNLRVTSSGGCIKDTSRLINSIHPQPIIGFHLRKDEICLQDAVYLTDSTKNPEGLTEQWNWDMGDSKLRNTQNVLYIYTEVKTYNISLYTVSNFGCRSETLVKPVSVYPYPVVDAGPDRKVLEGNSITIDATANGIEPKYIWTPSQYLNSPTLLKPTSNPKFDILYTLTVTGKGGCIVTDNMFVDVLKIPLVPNTFSPNNDRINDYWKIQYLDEYSNSHVQVFTRTGQMVFESRGQYKPWDGACKGKPLPVDTYFYIIEPGNGREPFSGYVIIAK